jgi:hypothetical protein
VPTVNTTNGNVIRNPDFSSFRIAPEGTSQVLTVNNNNTNAGASIHTHGWDAGFGSNPNNSQRWYFEKVQ